MSGFKRATISMVSDSTESCLLYGEVFNALSLIGMKAIGQLLLTDSFAKHSMGIHILPKIAPSNSTFKYVGTGV